MHYSPSSRSRRSSGRTRYSRRVNLLIPLICLAVVLVLAWPFLEPFMLTTERTDLVCPELPADISHLHVVYLSDIHWGFFFSDNRLKELVDRINALKPDVILLGGDYATDSTSAIEFFRRLPAFHARYAVCAVPGKSDRTAPSSNLEVLHETIRDAGIIPLFNEVATVRVGNSAIKVAGLDDVETGTPDVETVASQCTQSDFVIAMAHSPNAIPSIQAATGSDGKLNWIDLGLFGATHGGQMALFSDLLNIATVPDRYRGGWLQENRVPLLVSRGVGTSVIPARLFRTPQIHDIYLSTK